MIYIKRKELIGVLILLACITLYSCWRILLFGFWKDDWISYWGAKTFSPTYYSYWFHPGTTIQFAFLSFLFPPNSIAWQIAGLVWKVLASLSVYLMISHISKSKKTGVVGGAFFAGSQFGLDATGWPSATVVLMDVCFLSLAIAGWIRYLESKATVKSGYPWVLTGIALFVDPFRTIPLIFFIALLFTRYSTQLFGKFFNTGRKYRLVYFFLIIIGIFLSIPLIQETVLYKYVIQSTYNVSVITEKLYLFGNYFSSIFNIMVGLFLPGLEYLSTGVYDRVGVFLTIILLIILIIFFIFLSKKRDQRAFPFAFLLLWLLLFYLPNFLSEPRLTMGATHRYSTIASVGWIGIVVILLSFIRSKILYSGIAIIVLIFAVHATHIRTEEWLIFRSRAVLMRIWETVDNDLPKETSSYMLVLSGNHSIITDVLNYSYTAPLRVLRNMHASSKLPVMVNSAEEVIPILCRQPNFSTDSIYGWSILKDGSVTDKTEDIRNEVVHMLRSEKCDD